MCCEPAVADPEVDWRDWIPSLPRHLASGTADLKEILSLGFIYICLALLCAQANSASYPQRDGKWVGLVADGLRGEGL